ncbi:MAG: hypothetical protein QXX87_05010 [Candidatus Jordarchaeales archaeon]
MGLREIRERIEMKKSMEKKALELKLEELEKELEKAMMVKEKIESIAEKYGVIIAASPKFQEEVKLLREKYGIPESAVISQIVKEEDVLKEKMFGLSKSIDYEKLGLLIYQRALFRRKETGGVMSLGEVCLLIDTGKLKGKIKMDDVKRALKELEKKRVIPGLRQLKSGVEIAIFIPAELSDDQNEVLNLASEKGFITLEELMVKTGWTKERAERVLKSLEESGIARKEESYAYGEKYYFPGLTR